MKSQSATIDSFKNPLATIDFSERSDVRINRLPGSVVIN
jgi:hypothetical protein